jgi:hypothetical protein
VEPDESEHDLAAAQMAPDPHRETKMMLTRAGKWDDRLSGVPSRRWIGLPPTVALRFFEDMRAFQRERNPIMRDEIAARQLHALNGYCRPHERKLRLSDVKELFEQMRDWRK